MKIIEHVLGHFSPTDTVMLIVQDHGIHINYSFCVQVK
jgi:hypothetical protein